MVDSGNISCGQGLLVLHAAKLAKQGAPVQKILEEIKNAKHKIRSSFLLPNTRIFYERGFTDKITAKICDIFQLHPILGTFNNKLTIIGVRWGKLEKAWRKYIRYHLRNISRIDDSIIFIVHAGCSVKQQEIILNEVNRCMKFKQIVMVPASSASVCNAGLGSIGFAIYRK